jgi:hypothetical protein
MKLKVGRLYKRYTRMNTGIEFTVTSHSEEKIGKLYDNINGNEVINYVTSTKRKAILIVNNKVEIINYELLKNAKLIKL